MRTGPAPFRAERPNSLLRFVRHGGVLRSLSQPMLARWVIWVMALAACETVPEDEARFPVLVCGRLFARTEGIASTHPFIGDEVQVLQESACWLIDVDQDASGGGPVTLSPLLADGGACRFSGVSNQVRAELDRGACVFPTATGYAHFQIDRATGFNPLLWSTGAFQGEAGSVDIAGRWFEVRGEDELSGRATLILDVTSTRPETPAEVAAAAAAREVWLTCAVPACFQVDFAGHGELVGGSDPPCAGYLASFAEPFSVVVDARGFMAFSEDIATVADEDWLAGGPQRDRCGIHAFAGQRGGQNQRYAITWDEAGQGVMSMDIEALFSDGTMSSMCRTRWTSALAACP